MLREDQKIEYRYLYIDYIDPLSGKSRFFDTAAELIKCGRMGGLTRSIPNWDTGACLVAYCHTQFTEQDAIDVARYLGFVFR
jgi:hypothetical protein